MKKYLMNVAALAMVSAVTPPSLLNVCRQMAGKEEPVGKFVVDACFLKTTISRGVIMPAIKVLDAREDNKMFTNWYLPL